MSNPSAFEMPENADGAEDAATLEAQRESVYRGYLNLSSFILGGSVQPHCAGSPATH